MSSILAGHFQLQDDIDQARAALIAAGFPAPRISAFYVNQPGQHDLYAYGGDREDSPGARETPAGVGKGVAVGGVVGAALGAASALVAGPAGPVLGALVGAHVGSLYSLHSMKEADQPEVDAAPCAPQRKPGMMIAVALGEVADRERALTVLRRLGAGQIEQAEGTIEGGDWLDFDPLGAPRLLS
ncbi:hypothetical protein AAKU55_001805 [Oxalobacteraceae bacterium GrIS 1.11]